MAEVIFEWLAKIFLYATLLYLAAILYVKVIVDGMDMPGWRGKLCEVFNGLLGWAFAILILFSYLYYKTIGRVIAIPAIDDFNDYKRKEDERIKRCNREKEKKISEQSAIINRITKENIELRKRIKEKEACINTINDSRQIERETVSRWIKEKNELNKLLTSRVQELEDRLGIDNGFDKERNDRIRQLVMDKIYGKDTK